MYLYEAKCQEQPPGEPSPRHQPLLNVPLQICGFVLVLYLYLYLYLYSYLYLYLYFVFVFLLQLHICMREPSPMYQPLLFAKFPFYIKPFQFSILVFQFREKIQPTYKGFWANSNRPVSTFSTFINCHPPGCLQSSPMK